MAYSLSIQVFGRGDTTARSHWAFLIHKPGENYGDLHEVQLIDLQRLWYESTSREGTDIVTPHTVGMCRIARLDARQRLKTKKVIKSEPAPRDGRKRCQDWVFETLISLEVEELVRAGTAERWKRRVGMSARDLAQDCAGDWIGLG